MGSPSVQDYFWIHRYKLSHKSIKDEARSTCPSELTKEMIGKIYGIVMNDSRVLVPEIAEVVSILLDTVQYSARKKL